MESDYKTYTDDQLLYEHRFSELELAHLRDELDDIEEEYDMVQQKWDDMYNEIDIKKEELSRLKQEINKRKLEFGEKHENKEIQITACRYRGCSIHEGC